MALIERDRKKLTRSKPKPKLTVTVKLLQELLINVRTLLYTAVT